MPTRGLRHAAVATLLIALGGAPASSATEATNAPEPAAAPETRLVDPTGFLYGVVETRGKRYEGRLRWHRRDAFWSDFLYAGKEDRPYERLVPLESRLRTHEIEIMGSTVGSKRSLRNERRSLVLRYGHLDRIEVHNRSWSTLVLRDGSEVETSGGRDLRSDILIYDAEGQETRLEWRRILRIRFLPTPADLEAPIHRMYGTVKTNVGDFTGYVQWDKEEGTSEDLIDGDQTDGGGSHKVPMGEIRSIEKIDGSSCRLTLTGGDVLELRGTNDVNRENRGIWVEVPEWGRIAVSWEGFERVDFAPPPGTGPSYDSFASPTPLLGTVTTKEGKAHEGRLVYDIDEAASWEFLNGEAGNLEYDIPFELVRTIEPLSENASRVTLHSGASVELRNSADIDDGNDGLLVFDASETPAYIAWRDVARVELAATSPDE